MLKPKANKKKNTVDNSNNSVDLERLTFFFSFAKAKAEFRTHCMNNIQILFLFFSYLKTIKINFFFPHFI